MTETGSEERMSDHTRACGRCVLFFLSVVVASVVALSVADHISLAHRGYEASVYNGSTLRSLREVFRPGDSMGDSWRPMKEALRMLQSPDGGRLYEKVFFEDKVKFQYPPTSLVPLAALDFAGLASLQTLDILNAAVFSAGCLAFAYFLLSLLGIRDADMGRYWPLALLVMLSALLYYPSVRALQLGQIQVWINTAFTFACIAWLRGARATAGALLALAAAIKPQLGIFLVWGLLWREWPFVRGFLATGLPIGVVSLLMFGLHNHIAYLDVLSFLSRHGEAFYSNHSVNGLANRALGNGVNLKFEHFAFPPEDLRVMAVTFLSSIALLSVALLPALTAGPRRPDIVEIAITALCATLASPIVWEHHYGVLLPPLGIALAFLCATSAHSAALAWLAASWIMSANYLPFMNHLSDTWLNFAQSYLLFAGLILLGVLLHLRRQNRAGWVPSGKPQSA